MAKVNMAQIMVQVSKDAGADRVLRKAATERAQQVFDDAVIGLRKEFEESPITQEIDGGIGASNLSKTLVGGSSVGAPKNLYSFIGFDAGTEPTQVIRDAFNSDHKAGPKLGKAVKVQDKVPRYQFKVNGPKLDEIYAQTPLPRMPGLSWAEKVETYIPGFAQFLNKFMGDPSKSGGGIQVHHDKLRPGASFTKPEGGYLKGMVANFYARIENYKKGGMRRRF